jgi:hypothetical protein
MGNISIPVLQVFVSAFVALFVVALGHAFSVRRDRQNRRQEQRIDYLISVYRAFCKANHHPRLYEVADEVEQAIADVQLFGTPAQVQLVQKFADELGTRQEAPLNEILIELRDSLRMELGADALPKRQVWLRIGRNDPEPFKVQRPKL